MNQRGFSLVSVMVSSLIVTVGFLFISQILLQTQVIGHQQDRYAGFNDMRDQMMSELADSCAITNSVQDPKNIGLRCLEEGQCVDGTSGELILRDRQNQLVYSKEDKSNYLLSSVGGKCSGPNCIHEMKLKYTVKCPDGVACKIPYVLIEGDFDAVTRSEGDKVISVTADNVVNYQLYRFEKQIYHKKPFLSCFDALTKGKDVSGLYIIDPDGNGGECPFEVYCDQGNEGGGWALVANQSMIGDALRETLPPLHKGMTGRLSNRQMEALLKNSNFRNGNSVMAVVNSKSTGTYMLSFHVPEGQVGAYTTTQPVCNKVSAAPEPTQRASATQFQFFARSATAQMGYNGKFFCSACDTSQPPNICEVPAGGCCDSDTGGSMEGSLWIR